MKTFKIEVNPIIHVKAARRAQRNGRRQPPIIRGPRAVASHFCAQGELMNFAPPQGRTEKLVTGRGWPEYLATFFSTRRPTSKISVQKILTTFFF
jgi:hypothetical protein